MLCLADACHAPSAVAEFGAVATDPALDVLCLSHFRDLVRRRAVAASATANAALRAGILAMAAPTCYGEAGRCPNTGDPYPGGPYCPIHAPNPFAKSRLALRSDRDIYHDEADDADPFDGEAMLQAVECPDAHTPANVRAACKHALANGWDYRVTLAIGPIPAAIHSVVFRAYKDGVTLSSRHEGTEIKTLGFKIAWYSPATGLPTRIGWRELVAALQGTSPTEIDKQHTRDAVLAVMDVGGALVEILHNG